MALLRLCFLLVAVSLLTGLVAGCGGSSNYTAVPSAGSADLTPTVAAVWDAEGGLRIGTSADFPPSNFINERGEIDGFERDLGDELCRAHGTEM